jgi:hypothetical protein
MEGLATALHVTIHRFRILGSQEEMEEQGGDVAESGKVCLWVRAYAQHGSLLAVDSLVDRMRNF